VGRFARPIFETSISVEPDCVRVVLRGELDLSTTPLLYSELDRAEALREPVLLLDLAELTFIDGAGLTALLEAARRAAERGGRLRISRPSAPIRRLFQLTAIDQSLEVTPA